MTGGVARLTLNGSHNVANKETRCDCSPFNEACLVRAVVARIAMTGRLMNIIDAFGINLLEILVKIEDDSDN